MSKTGIDECLSLNSIKIWISTYSWIWSSASSSLLFIYVPEEDSASNGIAAGHFDGSILSAIAGDAFALCFNSQASQDISSNEVGAGLFLFAFGGVTSLRRDDIH